MICLVLAIFTAKKHARTTMMLFTASDILDMFDGIVARKYNQQSFLGACLDMSIDRTSSTVITLQIFRFASVDWVSSLLSLFVLVDLVSHWLRYSFACKFSKHHKELKSQFKLLDFYYENKTFLTFECAAYQTFLISYYSFLAGHGSF